MFKSKLTGKFRTKTSWLLAVILGIPLIWAHAPLHAQMQPGPMRKAFPERFGRWWDRPEIAQQLGLTAQQKQKMDDIFQDSRLKLIDLHANLEKQQVILQPLIESDQPDEGKILAQIDAVAQARAELEKGNARMLLGLRRVLTQEQWTKLKALRSEHHMEWEREGERPEHGRFGPGGPHGPGGPNGPSGPVGPGGPGGFGTGPGGPDGGSAPPPPSGPQPMD